MKNYREILKEQNRKVEHEFLGTKREIEKLSTELAGEKSKVGTFLYKVSQKIISSFHDVEGKELEALNKSIYSEVANGNYESSYLDPEFSTKIFGNELGSLLGNVYLSYNSYPILLLNDKRYVVHRRNNYFIELVKTYRADEFSYDSVVKIVNKDLLECHEHDIVLDILKTFDESATDNRRIVMESNIKDTSYLYRYSKYITDNEVKTAHFFMNYPQEKIEEMAKTIADGYIRSFELNNKDLSKKKTVCVNYNIGQERLVRSLVSYIEFKGLRAVLNNSMSTDPCKQLDYDYRFSMSLSLDKSFTEKFLKVYSSVTEKYEKYLKNYSGVIYFDKFGEKPFAPKAKECSLKFSDEQQVLIREFSTDRRKTLDKYVPRSETSFCIVAFPTPEIGDKFEEIFEETMKINMLDSIHYEGIQQKLVDAMDLADYVHIKGKGNNRTDIKVNMHKLEDPSKHTNFVNCGADVNIPVGEVFTSPKLSKTDGVLHVSEIFLDGLKYIDLEIKFKDGMTVDYTCENFDNDEDNKKFIQENLMFPHKNLPLGEFAIGTNTMAHVMAKKYDILEKLPILIVEKMGPHFAIGDTCFSWSEDFKVYNPIDKKEITARDNEVSILRKTDIQKAYTGCHTDITLPYEELDFISVQTYDGKSIDVIRDGRFVVPGTEELNIPLDNY